MIEPESISCLMAAAHSLLPTARPLSTVGAPREARLLVQVCLQLPTLGLLLIDPLLLKHPAIDPPRERKKKWEKKIN